MAEVIYLHEFEAVRRRARSRAPERESLERAVAILRENLCAAAHELLDAPIADQSELLDRIENLAAMIRYGMRMLGEIAPEPDFDHHVFAGSR